MIEVFGESRPVCLSKVEPTLERSFVWCNNSSKLNADGLSWDVGIGSATNLRLLGASSLPQKTRSGLNRFIQRALAQDFRSFGSKISFSSLFWPMF